MLPQRLVLVVLVVQRHVLGHDGHDLRVHVRLQDRNADELSFPVTISARPEPPWIWEQGTHPEPVLVEDVSGDPDAGDARHGDEGDEPAELRHAVGCATCPRTKKKKSVTVELAGASADY